MGLPSSSFSLRFIHSKTTKMTSSNCCCPRRPPLFKIVALLFIFSLISLILIIKEEESSKAAGMAERVESADRDELTESLNDLFTSISTMIKGELQGTNNLLELLEKMNVRVAEEYKGFGDVASGLRVFVEQLKEKNGNFNEYVQQIDAMEQQLTEFEAVTSMLDKYVAKLESKVISAYQHPPP